MLNQVVIVGRLVRDAELKETENKKSYTKITLAVDRSFKNMAGEYETDFIDCILWKGIAESTEKYTSKGDMLGVKGRIQVRNFETETGEKRYVTEIVAEKVTFLSTKNKEID